MESNDLADEAAEAADAEAPAPLPGLFSRILMVVTNPVKLFTALRDRPAAWGALLTAALLTAAATFAIPADVFQDMVRDQMIRAGREIPPGFERMGWFSKIFGMLSTFVGIPLAAAIQTALFCGVFLFGLGFEGRFKQYFAVTAHVSLIAALAAVVLLPARIAARQITLSPSLEAFLPFLEEGFLFRWLSMQDLFALWSIALVGIGAGVLDGRGRLKLGAGVAVGAFLLVTLVIASLTG